MPSNLFGNGSARDFKKRANCYRLQLVHDFNKAQFATPMCTSNVDTNFKTVQVVVKVGSLSSCLSPHLQAEPAVAGVMQ